jgi:hypothetical protein
MGKITYILKYHWWQGKIDKQTLLIFKNAFFWGWNRGFRIAKKYNLSKKDLTNYFFGVLEMSKQSQLVEYLVNDYSQQKEIFDAKNEIIQSLFKSIKFYYKVLPGLID